MYVCVCVGVVETGLRKLSALGLIWCMQFMEYMPVSVNESQIDCFDGYPELTFDGKSSQSLATQIAGGQDAVAGELTQCGTCHPTASSFILVIFIPKALHVVQMCMSSDDVSKFLVVIFGGVNAYAEKLCCSVRSDERTRESATDPLGWESIAHILPYLAPGQEPPGCHV